MFQNLCVHDKYKTWHADESIASASNETVLVFQWIRKDRISKFLKLEKMKTFNTISDLRRHKRESSMWGVSKETYLLIIWSLSGLCMTKKEAINYPQETQGQFSHQKIKWNRCFEAGFCHKFLWHMTLRNPGIDDMRLSCFTAEDLPRRCPLHEG